MTTSAKRILTYSIDLEPAQNIESVSKEFKFALGALLVTAGTLLQREEFFDLGAMNRLTINLETQLWDQRFVLSIEKLDEPS